jgi:hypothetical protein
MEFNRRRGTGNLPQPQFIVGQRPPGANDSVLLAERRNELRWAYIRRYLRRRGKEWSELSNWMQGELHSRAIIYSRTLTRASRV